MEKYFRNTENNINIISIISGNFEINMKEIIDLKAEVSDIKDRLQFAENIIEKKVATLETELEYLEDKVHKNQRLPDKFQLYLT